MGANTAGPDPGYGFGSFVVVAEGRGGGESAEGGHGEGHVEGEMSTGAVGRTGSVAIGGTWGRGRGDGRPGEHGERCEGGPWRAVPTGHQQVLAGRRRAELELQRVRRTRESRTDRRTRARGARIAGRRRTLREVARGGSGFWNGGVDEDSYAAINASVCALRGRI